MHRLECLRRKFGRSGMSGLGCRCHHYLVVGFRMVLLDRRQVHSLGDKGCYSPARPSFQFNGSFFLLFLRRMAGP